MLNILRVKYFQGRTKAPGQCLLLIFALFSAVSFAEEPTAVYDWSEPEGIDWSDPNAVAYMNPELICPFTAEIYPSTFSKDDVVFLKLQFENTLDRDAYALADEEFSSVFYVSAVILWLFLDDGVSVPILRPDHFTMKDTSPKRLWRKLSPGERGRVLYLPVETSFSDTFTQPAPAFTRPVAERLASGKELSGYFTVAVASPGVAEITVRSNPVTLKPRSSEEEKLRPNFSEESTWLQKFESNKTYLDKSADFRKAIGVYLSKYPSESNRIRALHALFSSRKLNSTDGATTTSKYPAVDKLRTGLDQIEDENYREGLKAYYRGQAAASLRFYPDFTRYVEKTLGYEPKRVGSGRIVLPPK